MSGMGTANLPLAPECAFKGYGMIRRERFQCRDSLPGTAGLWPAPAGVGTQLIVAAPVANLTS